MLIYLPSRCFYYRVNLELNCFFFLTDSVFFLVADKITLKVIDDDRRCTISQKITI